MARKREKKTLNRSFIWEKRRTPRELLRCNARVKRALALLFPAKAISTSERNKWGRRTAACSTRSHEGWGDGAQNSRLTEVNTRQMNPLSQYNGCAWFRGRGVETAGVRRSVECRCLPPARASVRTHEAAGVLNLKRATATARSPQGLLNKSILEGKSEWVCVCMCVHAWGASSTPTLMTQSAHCRCEVAA